ncbi:MAG: ABC transporter ATP-binding protein [Candidatus Hodarchaeota archaeon]
MATRWLINYLLGRKKLLLLDCGLNVGFALATVIIPVITGGAIDAIVNGLSTGSINEIEIITFCVLILGIAILRYILRALIFYVGQYYANQLCQDLRTNLFATLQKQSHKYFDQHSTGDLVSKTTNDMLDLWDMGDLPEIASQGFTLFFLILGFLFYFDPLSSIIVLISFPLLAVILMFFEHRLHRVVNKARVQFGQLSKVLQENIDGVRVVRAYNAKETEITRFSAENKRYRKLNLHRKKLDGGIFPQMRIMAGLISAIVLITASFSVIDGRMSLGVLITIVLLTGMLYDAIDYITGVVAVWGSGHGASIRIREILDSTPEIRDDSNAIELQKDTKGTISFNHVSFGYRNEPVLKDIHFRIAGRKTVAILGATGSGKSSLINLIPRFYEVTNGSVTIDGIDIRKIQIESLRRRIGFVDQETFLFSKSVHENIAFGYPDASREDVIRVAKMARAHDFIMAMERGYDTAIGEKGVRLSGGQKQRISIARALLADPLIVIMDDSLSSVDTKTEQEIQEATNALLKDRTTILVTQRLSSLSYVDWIVILSEGYIVEQGTHSSLVTLNGIYKKLLDTQQDGLIDLENIIYIEQRTRRR